MNPNWKKKNKKAKGAQKNENQKPKESKIKR